MLDVRELAGPDAESGDAAALASVLVTKLARAGNDGRLWDVLYVATAGGRAIGSIEVRPYGHSGCVAVCKLYVDPAWRKRGVASRLLDVVERDAFDDGAEAVSLNVSNASPVIEGLAGGDDVLVGMYRRRGYFPTAPGIEADEVVFTKRTPNLGA
jgi:GNAT superfamily N-acetyltransferase